MPVHLPGSVPDQFKSGSGGASSYVHLVSHAVVYGVALKVLPFAPFVVGIVQVLAVLLGISLQWKVGGRQMGGGARWGDGRWGAAGYGTAGGGAAGEGAEGRGAAGCSSRLSGRKALLWQVALMLMGTLQRVAVDPGISLWLWVRGRQAAQRVWWGTAGRRRCGIGR